MGFGQDAVISTLVAIARQLFLFCQPPYPQPGKTERDTSNTEFATPHAEHGLLGNDLGSVLFQL